MADNQPQHWQIGMWGPLASGKTTYLASVYLRHREVGWEIEPSDPSEATTMGFLTGGGASEPAGSSAQLFNFRALLDPLLAGEGFDALRGEGADDDDD